MEARWDRSPRKRKMFIVGYYPAGMGGEEGERDSEWKVEFKLHSAQSRVLIAKVGVGKVVKMLKHSRRSIAVTCTATVELCGVPSCESELASCGPIMHHYSENAARVAGLFNAAAHLKVPPPAARSQSDFLDAI